MKHKPPAVAKKILSWFCPVEFLEEIEGDLQEQFYERLQKQGVFRARLYYMLDVFQTLKPYPMKRTKVSSQKRISPLDSLQHFFKVFYRNMQRSKSVTFINIAGLAVSLASFLLISLYVIDESTYDSFHPNADHVYRISHSYIRHGDGARETDARAPGLWAGALKESVPEIKRYTRFSRFGYPGNVRSEKEDKIFVEQEFFWADPNYTEIFSLPLVAGGEAGTILKDPKYVIINETMAGKYFGKKDPIGEPLIYSRDGMDFNLVVGGVMKNYPSNAHFHPDFIVNNKALDPLWKRNNEDRVNSWGDPFTYSFVEVESGTNPDKIRDGLSKIFHTRLGADDVTPEVVKLTDLHFTSGMLVELEASGSRTYLYIFGSLGLLILLIACINYMNLATARSVKRSKEVGLRKTLGVNKRSLIMQFLGESLLTTTFAVLVAVVLLTLILPLFNDITSKHFEFQALLRGKFLVLLIVLIFIEGIVAGSYPAFYLSGFKPAEVLKGKFKAGTSSENFRKVLVVFQFSITLVLLVGTVVISRQLAYINDTRIGEYKDQIIMVRTYGIDLNKFPGFKQRINQDPAVADIALGTHIPRQERFGWIDTRIKIPSISASWYTWKQLEVDFDFPSLFNLEFIAGRDFAYQNRADSSAVILNESAVKDLKLTPDKVLGMVIDNEYPAVKRTVIGVVKDFSYASMREKILPLVISGDCRGAEILYIRLGGNNFPEIIESIHQAWKQVYPSTPFDHRFMDEEFERLYELETRTATIFKYFAGLAIFIGCLGLFGLASFTAEQKTKEIGIRKVLGASVMQVLLSLTSRFVKLICISFLIGIPLAYAAMHLWLENFAYKTEIGWFLFFSAGIFILLLTCLTVGIESLRAALANPVDSIRHE